MPLAPNVVKSPYLIRGGSMPRASKTSYSVKQKRQAKHIEKSNENKGRSKDDAEKIAWSTVNRVHNNRKIH
jgi:hypothetical protein